MKSPKKEYKLYGYRYLIAFMYCFGLIAKSITQSSFATIAVLCIDAYKDEGVNNFVI